MMMMMMLLPPPRTICRLEDRSGKEEERTRGETTLGRDDTRPCRWQLG